MSPELKSYLRKNGWKRVCGWWDKSLNFFCDASIYEKDNGYIYTEDCPDLNMPLEDYFEDIFFETEEKLMEYLVDKFPPI